MMNLETLARRLKFLRRAAVTKRYHTENTLMVDTVGHHSFNVAWLCWLLAGGKPSVNLIMAALAHDAAEHALGDIPSPAKRALNIRTIVNDTEDRLLDEHGLHFSLTSEELRTLSMADSMDGYLFCCNERAMGNKNIVPVAHNFRSYLIERQPWNDVERDIMCIINELWWEANDGKH